MLYLHDLLRETLDSEGTEDSTDVIMLLLSQTRYGLDVVPSKISCNQYIWAILIHTSNSLSRIWQ